MRLEYPTSTQLEENFSIFVLNLQHRIKHEHFKFNSLNPANNPRFRDWISSLESAGWESHEYLFKSPADMQRRFRPHSVLTSYAHESLFGQSRFNEKDRFAGFLEKQLNPNNPSYSRAETLLLSLRKSPQNWIQTLLLTTEDVADVCDAGGTHFHFEIEWVDLWIFPDTIATLAFKVVLKSVQDNCEGPHRAPKVGDLSAFNRWFRHTLYKGLLVCQEIDADRKCHWWADIVFGRWLKNGHVLFPPKKAGWNALSSKGSSQSTFDWHELIHGKRYAKILTAARIPDLPYENVEQAKQLEGLWQGSDFPEYESYGPLHSALVTELATASDEGAAIGVGAYMSPKGRKWRYHPDYLNRLYSQNKISVWFYWNGVVLRDCCAFLAWDSAMPIVNQAESHYYPLYVHICHLHFRLDDFAGKVIDYRLDNTRQANQLLEEFHAFRNQYWFKEMTAGFVGVEVYRGMMKGLGIVEQFSRVSDEIAKISKYLNDKQNKGWQFIIGIAVVFFYPVQMVWKELLRHWPGYYLEFWRNNPSVVVLLGLLCLWLGVRLLRMRPGLIRLRQRLSAWGYRCKFLD